MSEEEEENENVFLVPCEGVGPEADPSLHPGPASEGDATQHSEGKVGTYLVLGILTRLTH